MRIPFLILTLAFTTACTQASKKADTNQQFYGEFLHLDKAAVLNTGTEIYGVIINEKMKELHDLCVPLKNSEYDMIPVYIKGTIVRKQPDEDGWEKRIEIFSIDSLVNPADNSILKPN